MTEKFQLKRGGELEIQLVSAFYINKVRVAARKKHLEEHHDGKEPTPPQYAVRMGGGTIPGGAPLPEWEETHDYTEKTIDKAGQEDKEVWIEYIQATNELLRIEGVVAWEVYYDRGVVDSPPDDDNWATIQQEDGIEVPDRSDRRAYKIHWLDTEKVLDRQEADWLLLTIKGQGDQVREMQRIAAGMFQRPVGEQDRTDDR